MKQITRVLGLFLCIFTLLTVNALAADAKIDMTHAADGYFSVSYPGTAATKMKIGVTYAGKTTFLNYTPGTEASYSFERGNGTYTITLYRNTSGISYKKVLQKSAVVQLKNALAPYLASTMEVTFVSGDSVSKTAADLCAGLKDDASKIVTIHNYIAGHFCYNKAFAESVRKGLVKNYTPDTNHILKEKTGVCYDFSALFAAMCRSQGIPCTLEKGYTSIGYHAWNRVWLNDGWVALDLTAAVVRKVNTATTIAQCAPLAA